MLARLNQVQLHMRATTLVDLTTGDSKLISSTATTGGGDNTQPHSMFGQSNPNIPKLTETAGPGKHRLPHCSRNLKVLRDHWEFGPVTATHWHGSMTQTNRESFNGKMTTTKSDTGLVQAAMTLHPVI